MQRSDILALLGSLGITGLLLWGLVYFVNEWWARLPKAVAPTVCILLAVMVIGYPSMRWHAGRIAIWNGRGQPRRKKSGRIRRNFARPRQRRVT